MTRDLSALAALIEARQAAPFAWGRHDCVTFAAAAVRAQGGALKIPGRRWRSEAGAARALARAGGLEAAVDGVLRRVPPAFAARGDVALVDGARGPLLAVVEGQTLVGPGPRGLERLPREAMRAAWSAL